jgi:hypothetical protein
MANAFGKRFEEVFEIGFQWFGEKILGLGCFEFWSGFCHRALSLGVDIVAFYRCCFIGCTKISSLQEIKPHLCPIMEL